MNSIETWPLWQVVYAKSRNGVYRNSALIRAANANDASAFVSYRYPKARVLCVEAIKEPGIRQAQLDLADIAANLTAEGT